MSLNLSINFVASLLVLKIMNKCFLYIEEMVTYVTKVSPTFLTHNKSLSKVECRAKEGSLKYWRSLGKGKSHS